MLKSRYSGEHQVEKYRAELHIRSRKQNESLSGLHQDIRRLMALAYPKLTAEEREEIACDHFTNALSDTDFALKIKERAPTSLDEALRIGLRLEAWEKSTKIVKNDEDRTDRTKLKARSVGKQSVPKNPELGDNDIRMKKMETDISKLSADVKELMQLVTSRQQSVQNWSGPPVQQSSQLPAPPPFRGMDTRRFD